MIHMKCQNLFSLKNKQKFKMSSAAVVTGTLKVELIFTGLFLLSPGQHGVAYKLSQIIQMTCMVSVNVNSGIFFLSSA